MASYTKLSSGSAQRVDRRVYALFIVFGLGSWITVNGLFAELKLFSDRLPEGDRIFADAGLAIQLANVAPLVYGVCRRPGRPVVATTVVLLVGAVAATATGLLWDRTVLVGGHERSVYLLVGIFMVAAVDCTTTLLFWPFVAEFKSAHVTALAVGEGATGILATALVLIQLKGDLGSTDLVFPVSVYFGLMAIIVLVSLAAFGILHAHPLGQRELVARSGTTTTGGGDYAPLVNDMLPDNDRRQGVGRTHDARRAEGPDWRHDEPCTSALPGRPHRAVNAYEGDGDDGMAAVVSLASPSPLSSRRDNSREYTPCPSSATSATVRLWLFVMLAWLSALQNGVKPAVMPYAVTSSASFELAQLVGLCVDPLGAAVALWFRPSATLHGLLCVGWTGCIGLLVLAAADPAFDRLAHASHLAVVAMVASFLLAYAKASALLHIKRATTTVSMTYPLVSDPHADSMSTTALFRAGVWVQCGSFIGSMVMWALVNYTTTLCH
eukprot:m.34230 g.34230  ORF g.34230 m.34230 type:complete len:495 (+) comp5118_c0_seq1:336-1820(+)